MTHSLSVTQQHDGKQFVCGNTFAIKDTLKKYGGIWDAGRKGWIMPQMFDPSVLSFTSEKAPTQTTKAPSTQKNDDYGEVPIAKAQRNDDDDFGEVPIVQTQRSDFGETPIAQSQRVGARMPPGSTILIPSTNTYKVKDLIAKAGGRWRPATKQWEVPADFDMSIIPTSEEKPVASAAAPASSGVGRPRVIHCGLCGQEGHPKNRCQCSHCGTIGMHRPDQCPTVNPRWKFLIQSTAFRCTCSATSLCTACEHACCREAKPLPCACLLKTECATHGTKCHGTHE